MPNLIVNKKLLLKRFPGKGGWTYAEIPEVEHIDRSNFGWVKVMGSIDDYQISDYSLAPMKNGRLFLPLRSELRRKLGKQAGDHIQVKLYKDDSPFVVPQEILECLLLEKVAYDKFLQLKDSEKRHLVKWIGSAKMDETKAERINQIITDLLKPR